MSKKMLPLAELTVSAIAGLEVFWLDWDVLIDCMEIFA